MTIISPEYQWFNAQLDELVRKRSPDRKLPWERTVPPDGINWWRIHAHALDRIEALLLRVLPTVEKVDDPSVWRGRHARGGPAFEVSMLSGRWICPALNTRGEDVVSLFAAVYGSGSGAAAFKLARILEIEAVHD